MSVEIDGKKYDVVVTRKIGNKRMYLRVKEDGKLYINCNPLISNRMILNFIYDNEKYIVKAIEKIERKHEKEEYFYYLGKKYDLVYLNNKDIIFGENKVFVNNALYK